MNQTRTSFLVAVVAGVSLLLRGAAPPASAPPAARGVPASAEAAAGAKPDRPPGAEAAQDSEDLAARRAYVGLYQEFLDVHPAVRQAANTPTQQVRGTLAEQPISIDVSTKPQEEPAGNPLLDIATAAQRSHLRLEFMLALVADPIDSRLGSDFDLALSALQLGLADAGYRFDRKWLPWVEPEPAEAAARKFRDRAGLLLFRRHPTGRQRCGFQEVGSAVPRPLSGNEIPGELLGVFLIGETPKLGIHKRAFHRAVDFVLRLHEAADLTRGAATSGAARAGTGGCATSRPLEIPVLGPLYSGSIVSLRIAIGNVLAPARDPVGGKAGICFRIVSGTASAPGFERHLEAGLWPRVLASRTLLPDDRLAARALGFLHDKLGWDLDRAALLVENDTSYGRHVLEHDIPTATDLKLLSFPSGLFALRNAWEATAAGPPGSAPSTSRPAPSSSKTALDVSLADQGTPVDVVAEMSPLTSRIEDMAMANLLRQISRERIDYLGIMATDVKDELFLAEQIRRFAPNVVLFVFDNDLLYMHPQYNATMFSTVTISNFPLAAEGASSLLSAGTPDPKSRRQFASEWQEGIFLAVGSLVGRASPPPAVWIAASGNYSMWPIAKLDVAPTERDLPMRWPFCVERLGPSLRAPQDCHGLARDPSLRAALEEQPPRQHAFSHLLTPMLGLVAISLFVFGGHFPRDPRRPRAVQPQTRRLQRTGTALLCLVGAVILVLGALGGFAWWHFLLLCACYLWLAWTFRRTMVPQEAVGGNRRARLGWAARRATAVAVPVLLPLLVLWLTARWLARWDFDDARLFAERARSLSGGLSPLVSLAWLGGAVFLWLLVETMRQLQGERQWAGWPLSDDLAAPLAGAAARAERIVELLRPIFPRGWHLWWIAGIVGVPFLHLLPRMQPIAEGRGYGIAALVGAAVVSALSLMAVFRFLRVWWCVRCLLICIAEAGLLEGIERVAPAVGWKPLQLLWYQPSVEVVTQSVVRLQQLIRLGSVPRRYDPDRLGWFLRQAFRGAGEGSLGVEVEARQELNRRFDEACLDLQDRASWPTISDFFAVRVIAYLRYVFGQLRFSVLEATFTGLPLMMAAATYAFQPKRLATLFLWTTLTASSAAMLSALVQMDRDPVLSAIGRTEPGKVSRDWSFISKIVIYGILPVLGLIASQFPTMGRLLSGLIQPLSRVLGAG